MQYPNARFVWLACALLAACQTSGTHRHAAGDADAAIDPVADGTYGWRGYSAVSYCDPKTHQAGDEIALCPPAADKGIQVHLGPRRYDDAAEVAKYMIAPGADINECAFVRTPDLAGKVFGQAMGRSRPGVHHVQLEYAAPADEERAEGSLGACGSMSQTQFIDLPQTDWFDIPDLQYSSHTDIPGDGGGLDLQGTVLPMEPARMLELSVHFLNTGDRPTLGEAWINLYFEAPGRVQRVLFPIALIAKGIKVAPHASGIVRRSCQTDVARDLKSLLGHSHDGMRRFSIWHKVAKSGALDKVYESYDPLSPALLDYGPLVNRMKPDPLVEWPGGSSGALMLEPGDSIVWECELQNNSDATLEDGDQMCNVFGAFALPKDAAGSEWRCVADSPL